MVRSARSVARKIALSIRVSVGISGPPVSHLQCLLFRGTSFTGVSHFDVNLRFTGGTDQEVTQAVQEMGFSSAEEMHRTINRALTTWIPRAMFVLVPLFAWLVSRVRPRSWRKYPHHVIFACHVFAVLFGAQSLAVAAGYLAGSATIAFALGVSSLRSQSVQPTRTGRR